MAEETEDSPSTFGDLKKTIVGVIATILTAGGGIVVTQFENLFGGGDETEVTAPTQSQSVNVSGPEIIINVPQAQPSVVREVVREVPVAQPKPDTVVVEPPKESAKDRLLKYKKPNQ